MLKKIVIIGPESTGKSTLCEQLSVHFETRWVPEYARQYLLEHGMDYSYDDLLTIAQGQVALEDTISAPLTNDLVFIDTDMYVMKVWCDFVFGKVHPWIDHQLKIRHYDLYLLCKPDLPWVKDELREYPDPETRATLFDIYKNLMNNQPVPYRIISGDYQERLEQAIKAVEVLT